MIGILLYSNKAHRGYRLLFFLLHDRPLAGVLPCWHPTVASGLTSLLCKTDLANTEHGCVEAVLLTLGKLQSKGLPSSAALEGLKSWQHNHAVVVQEDQGGLVLLPVTEDTGQLLGRQELHIQQQHYLRNAKEM